MDANSIQTTDDVAKPEPIHHHDRIGEIVDPTPPSSDVVIVFDFDETQGQRLEEGGPWAEPQRQQNGFKWGWPAVIRLSIVLLSITSGLLGGFLCRDANIGLGIGAGMLAVLMAIFEVLKRK